MFINPIATWMLGLLSVGLIAAAALLTRAWVDALPRTVRTFDTATGLEIIHPIHAFAERFAAWDPGGDRATALLALAALAAFLALFGRLASPWLWRRTGRWTRLEHHTGTRRLRTRQGHALHVEIDGPPGAPALVLVHGVGADRRQWREAVEDLSDFFRVHTFDLAGHGRSDGGARDAHTIGSAARDLDEVVALTESDHVVVAGHSMGGMIALEWCALHTAQRHRLAGLVIVTAPTHDPFDTMAPAWLHRALRKPVHEPLLRLMSWLSPLVRLTNALAYLNGGTHWLNAWTLFSGGETREQLDRSARMHARMNPRAISRYVRSMIAADVRPALDRIDVPTIVVAADRDGVTVPASSHPVALHVPGAELVSLRNARHLGYAEQRLKFAEAVLRLVRPSRERARVRLRRAV
jgi:pimeloyl-ACP methyl ester carboxylesterase